METRTVRLKQRGNGWYYNFPDKNTSYWDGPFENREDAVNSAKSHYTCEVVVEDSAS